MRSLKIGAAVHYAVSVIGRDGRTVRTLPRKRNLLLDSGLDLAASSEWANLFLYAVAGTGTNPVKRDSGAVTFSRAGNVVTASAGFFEAGDVGRLIKWDSGEEAYISAFNSSVEVETVDAGTIAADEGTVWYVNRTGLQTEVKRTSTYGTDSGDNGTSYAAGVVTFKRTFIFSQEVGAVVYNEIGWSPSNVIGGNLFGMDIITGGVALAAGQKLKVVVELSVSFAPAAPSAWANVITGWSTDGDHGVESVPVDDKNTMSFVRADGGSTNDNFGVSTFDASGTKYCVLSTSTAALIPITAATVAQVAALATKGLAPQPYISGTFTRNYAGSFTDAEGNSAAIRSISFGSINRNYRVLLDAAETKDSAHRLDLTFSLSWGRVLVN